MSRVVSAAVLSIAVLSVALLLAACGGGGTTVTTTDRPPITAALDAARKAFCRDLVAVGGGAEIRPEAIARLLPKLRHDAALYQRASDPTDAVKVRTFAAALARVRAAALGNGDAAAANAAVQRASTHLPGCTA